MPSAAARYRARPELLKMLDGYQPGQLAPMLRAERDMARARLTASGRGPGAAAFAAAVAGLREHSTPTTWLTVCATTPSTSATSAMTRPPGPRSAKLPASPSGCAASRSTALTPSSPPGPAPRPRDDGIGQSRPNRLRRARPLIRRSIMTIPARRR